MKKLFLILVFVSILFSGCSFLRPPKNITERPAVMGINPGNVIKTSTGIYEVKQLEFWYSEEYVRRLKKGEVSQSVLDDYYSEDY